MNRFHLLKSAVMVCLIVVASFSGVTSSAATSDLPGQWHGTMQTPAGNFSLELSVKEDEHGALAATLDSMDQAPGEIIPVSQIAVDKDQLKLQISAISAAYEGHFDADKGTWIGTWRQGISLPLTWVRGPVPQLPTFKGIDGIWRGTLTRNGAGLRLILRISTSNRGTRAKLDSPDMGVAGLDVTELSLEGDHVHLHVPAANVVFEGDLTDKAANLSGPWRREGMPAATVKFSRTVESAPLSEQRPQTPRAPFAYTIEPVTFSNAKDHISLAGTLTLPQGAGPFTAAVLISGSGPQDRDESIFGHQPFAVLADYLTRNGIAVLRFDDRGVGQSSGNYSSASIPQFANDVRAAVDLLAARPEIDASAIGLIGHSQGGIVGPIVATRNPSVAYLVLLAAPGTSMTEVLLSQRRMLEVMHGRNEASIIAEESAMAQLYEAVGKTEDHQAAQAKISALMTSDMMRKLSIGDMQKPAMIGQLTGDWLRDVLHYDATSTLGALTIPILALNGSLDQQVPSSANLNAIRIATAKNPDATVLQLPGLNHLFQTARSGAIAEYEEIQETFAPNALRTIGDWINVKFNRKNQKG